MKKKVVKIYNKSNNDLPGYSTELSAGFDIRADLSKFEHGNGYGEGYFVSVVDGEEKTLALSPGGHRVLIPTGLHVSIPDGYELQIRPRSGLALKNGITVLNSPGTIECDYLGEIGLIVINTDPNKYFSIKHGDRLAQGILNEVEQVIWEKVESLDGLGETDRGSGGFGHTGKN